jgi:Tol biopolymer transport system component
LSTHPLWRVLFLCCTISAACSADQPDEAGMPRVVSLTQITHDSMSKTGLLSDDSNLFVTEWPAARHVVTRFSLTGEDRSVLATGFPNIQALDLSRDGNKLLITPVQGGTSSTEFFSMPVNRTGSPQKIGNLTGRDAAWSPDGRQVVFGSGSSLCIANADGSGTRQVFLASGSVFAPRISADNKSIRFTVGNTSQNTISIWQVETDGSNPHPVLDGWEHASASCCGNWTADGRYYIFQVTQYSPTTVTTLWALREKKNNIAPVQLTSGSMSFGNPALGRDNKRLWAIGVKPVGDAVKYNAKTKAFVSLLSGVSATDLDFSIDGKWVTYVAVPDGTLWRSRADGTKRLQLTFTPERTALPRWSPDGKQIAYIRMQQGKPWKIALIPANGGQPKEVLSENQSQIDANWSTDGTRIMFGYLHDGEGIKIRIVDLKTQEVTTLPGSEGLFSPRWSPNGRFIAALSPDFTKVMLFDFSTQKWSEWLTEAAGAVSYPVWSADSKSLYFDDLVTDEESIRRVKVGSNRTERVFKLQGIERYPGPFGLWSGRTADGSYVFVRDRSTQEVYQLNVILP